MGESFLLFEPPHLRCCVTAVSGGLVCSMGHLRHGLGDGPRELGAISTEVLFCRGDRPILRAPPMLRSEVGTEEAWQGAQEHLDVLKP